MFAYMSESMASQMANPVAHGISDQQLQAINDRQETQKQLGPHHKLANYVYGHPIQSLFLMGAPVVGGIYVMKGGEAHLSPSQRSKYRGICWWNFWDTNLNGVIIRIHMEWMCILCVFVCIYISHELNTYIHILLQKYSNLIKLQSCILELWASSPWCPCSLVQ